jgi:hypothetical protein
MQDIDRPAHIQAFPHPVRAGGPYVQAQSPRDVPVSEKLHRIAGYGGRWRHLG